MADGCHIVLQITIAQLQFEISSSNLVCGQIFFTGNTFGKSMTDKIHVVNWIKC